jgi:hypothetical protein
MLVLLDGDNDEPWVGGQKSWGELETVTPKGFDSSSNKRGNLLDVEGRTLRGLSNADTRSTV